MLYLSSILSKDGQVGCFVSSSIVATALRYVYKLPLVLLQDLHRLAIDLYVGIAFSIAKYN